MTFGNKNKLLAAAALGALMACQGSAQADSTQAEIRLLKERLKQLESKVADQAKKEKALAAQVAPGHPPLVCKDGPCEPVPMPPPVWVSFGNGLKVESFEKDFSFAVGGRLHIDGGVNTEPVSGQSGNVILRRARLSAEGKAFKHWLYRMEYDFTGTGVAGIRDAWIAFKHPSLAVVPFTSQPLVIQVGNMKTPMGLEELTSANVMDFIERANPTDAFKASRHIGVAASSYGDNWSAKAGVFSTSVEDASLTPFAEVPGRPAAFGPSVATGGREYLDLIGRVTWAPIHTKDALIHLGGSGRFHKPNSATGSSTAGGIAGGADNRVMLLGRNINSEANALRTNLLGTPDLSCGPINNPATGPLVAARCVGGVTTYGAELALAYGPFSFQGEYWGTHYARNGGALAVARRATSNAGANSLGGTSLNFNGFYVSGTWYLTGESRAEAYSTSPINGAAFGNIKIKNPVSKGGWGAWEVAARYSQIDLNDSGIQGGRQEDITVGLNWYPDKGIRFMANWISVLKLSAPYDRPYLNGTHPNIFLMRAMTYW